MVFVLSVANNPPLDAQQLAAEVKQRARRLGFELCGVADAGASGHTDFLSVWLAEGRQGEMAWLAKRFEERADVRAYLPGAKSVVCAALSYNVKLAAPEAGELGVRGKVARYALGDDYHDHLKTRLHALADWLREATGCESRACVDTAPVLEREWAQRSGVGWQGKNTCTLDTKLGSYLLLGEIVTTAHLAPDAPAIDRCGTCMRCIDACPTNAITPYALDPRKCISYWTIEHRGEAETIPIDVQAGIGEWMFGCDICQEVCPWNRKAPWATDPLVQPREALASGSLDAVEVLGWTPEVYRETLRGSAMKRVKLPQLQRNARIVLNNITNQASGE